MSKRVRIGVPGIKINEACLAVLGVIAQSAREANLVACKPVALGHRALEQRAGISRASVVRSIRMLEENDLIIAYENNSENGAQLENSYALTAMGLEVLRLGKEWQAAEAARAARRQREQV